MSTKLLELHNRIITDTGKVVAKYPLIRDMLLQGKDISVLPTQRNNDIALFHKVHHSRAKQWESDGNVVGPPLSAYDWNIPEEYLDIDIVDKCYNILCDKHIDTGVYIDRLTIELEYIISNEMTGFLQSLIYVTDILRENCIVWGVGRGSSCASLVLFLLDINKIDPVKYNIPMEEFYK